MIALVDYGAGNLASVCKAFAALGAPPLVVRRPDEARSPAGIVVPGVGHFAATATLDDAWRAAIRAHIAHGVPLLGICLGMQWLFEASEEETGCPGLGLLPGTCRRLEGGPTRKVPHVGWNQLRLLRRSAALDGISDGSYVYFTHSYAPPVTPDCVASACHGDTFAAVVERGLVWGTQFHPEKSGDTGLRILSAFLQAATAARLARAAR